MTSQYKFTVFTPTYNRKHTLPKVYESLKGQTFKDFEWLIVDDGSTDGTEHLVREWISEGIIPIQYYYQINQGKQRAKNFAVKKAHAESFFTLDSDDYIFENTLERFNYHWENIPSEKRHEFAGVTGHCVGLNGALVGNKYPKDIFDSDMLMIREKYKIKGEKCGYQRTDVMHQYPFPEFENEKFIYEGVVWREIAQKYKTRFVNEYFRFYEIHPDSISNDYLFTKLKNLNGFIYAENKKMTYNISMKSKIKSASNFVRLHLHLNRKLPLLIKKSNRKALTTMCPPLGFLLFFKDIRLMRRSNKL